MMEVDDPRVEGGHPPPCKVIKIFKSSEDLQDMPRRLGSLQSLVKWHKMDLCYYLVVMRTIPYNEDTLFDSSMKPVVYGLLGDSTKQDYGLSRTPPQQQLSSSKDQHTIEVGPRIPVSSATSTNIVNILQAININYIKRVEVIRRYRFTLHDSTTENLKLIKERLYDPMIEQEYNEHSTSEMAAAMSSTPNTEAWGEFKPAEEGMRSTIKKISDNYGLGLDDDDVKMYAEYYLTSKRTITDVELYDFAQSNSEHCRHWLFNGKYIVDGEELPNSLFEMVKGTNNESTTNQNNIIKFCDNSSGIRGFEVNVLKCEESLQAPLYKDCRTNRNIIFTAETHNFPTAIEPFNGAATGTGGRIRDVQAAGRGAHVIAGTAGYCTGNLFIPGYKLPWETPRAYKKDFASPLSILLQASDGASDYGNKFGEPIIQGFARTYGDVVGGIDSPSERREWIKPIMFTGGVGAIDDVDIKKGEVVSGLLIVKVGGPAYKIGLGGGVASSTQVQGDNDTARDFNAVQRGDAEMEQKMNRVIRRCIEFNNNPIISIHDQGAGGNANVLKELIEPVGGIIFSEEFTRGDPTMNILELWVSEYQESNAMLIPADALPTVEEVAARERCLLDCVGVTLGGNQVQVHATKYSEEVVCNYNSDPRNVPVCINLNQFKTNKRKTFNWTKKGLISNPLVLESSLLNQDKQSLISAVLSRVLRLPAVGSKRFLTNKVDRSVTGLISQQQCVGPLHAPLADVAVTALSYNDITGAATSIGEQPLKLLVNPTAGARMAVAEALTNIVAAPITELEDIKCSANWMWPGKTGHDGWCLYEACEAMCEFMKIMGVAVDGGKDSLSMAARINNQDGSSEVVKSPGQLVVSAYAPCQDIRKVVTPDFKGPNKGVENNIIWVKFSSRNRLGGSALGQAYNTLGRECPDMDREATYKLKNTFQVIQHLIKGNRIEAIHDISDGGLITCLVEMGIAGWCGASVNFEHRYEVDQSPEELAVLFAEEAGWLLEVRPDQTECVMDELSIVIFPVLIGKTIDSGPEARIKISFADEVVLDRTVLSLAQDWEDTSHHLEELQKDNNMAQQEYDLLPYRRDIKYLLTCNIKAPRPRISQPPKVAVIREEGSNGDREMAAALYMAGFDVADVTTTDLLNLSFNINIFRGICFPGGFSFADVLGSAKGWAAVIRGDSRVNEMLLSWYRRADTFSLGVCNGCQLMARLGWIDADSENNSDIFSSTIQLTTNSSGRFESRWCSVKIEKTNSILLKDMAGSVLGVWVANKEGNFKYKTPEIYETLKETNSVALRYVDEDYSTTEKYPLNPSGSLDGVAGIVSQCGRHLAMMPHPERCFLEWQWPYLSNLPENKFSPWFNLFYNAYQWCLIKP